MANAAPVAVIDLPASIGSNRPLVLQGGASHDPDPGDSVVSWTWEVTPPTGTSGCEPLPSSGTGPDLTTIFPCAGDHAVALRVADTMGLSSATRTAVVRVQPTLDPPVVSVGADVAVDHRCAGAPLACTAWDGQSPSIALSAAGTAPAGATFSYRWTVAPPPELAGQPAPRVTFTPSDTAAAPRVDVQTAGTAISGRYVFAVQATDARGMVAVGRQRVDVGNRPPVVSGGGPVLLPHAFEPATGTFVATGTTPPATWSDPDGDPVTPVGFSSTRSGDGGNVLDVQDLGDRARVTVVVRYGEPSDAAFLIGPDVRRRVELWVADGNGGRGSTGWDVTVANRPPHLATAVASASVDHAFDAVGQRYVAEAALSTFVDDDGDPLALALAGDPLCDGLAERQGTALVTCALPYGGRPGVQAFAGTRTLRIDSRDPFEAGASQSTALEVRNRAPRMLATAVQLQTTCAPLNVCCSTDTGAKGCLEPDFRFDPVSAAPVLLVDDDGDPLDVALAPSDSCLAAAAPAQPCPAGGCALGLSMCGARAACGAWSPSARLALTADDGAARVAADLPVDAYCR